MKHIKRGRGSSLLDGIAYIAAGAFGVIWTLGALSMGAPPMFAMAGVVFILIAVVNAIYSLSNTTRKKRLSELDIVDSSEEPDPLNERFEKSGALNGERRKDVQAAAFCPYCGEAVQGEYVFCARCGKKLPE